MTQRHSKKEIREALKYAADHKWTVIPGGSHRWGHMRCVTGECRVNIKSTPSDVFAHRRDLIKAVDRCEHGDEKEE